MTPVAASTSSVDRDTFAAEFIGELCRLLDAPPGLRQLSSEQLARLARALWEARQTWPEVAVTSSIFARFMAERIDPDVTPGELLALVLPDLLLVCGCCGLDEAAVAAFSVVARPVVSKVVRRFDISGVDPVDMVDEIIERLIYGAENRQAKLHTFRGEGSLRQWLKVVAVRHAQNIQRSNAKFERNQEVVLADRATGSPELDLLQQQYGSQFAPCLKRAFSSLDARARNIVRLYYQEGLTGDEIGRLYRVHRTTISRWIAAAHDHLASWVCRDLAQSNAADEKELQSALKLIRSGLDISLRSVFATAPDAADDAH